MEKTRAYFICHRGGKHTSAGSKRKAKTQRNGRQAKLSIRQIIMAYSDNHNRLLLDYEENSLLPAYPKIDEELKQRIISLKKLGATTSLICSKLHQENIFGNVSSDAKD